MWLLFNGHSTPSLPSFLRSAWWSHSVHANQSCAWCDCRTVVCQPCLPPSSTNAFRFLSPQPQQQGRLYKRFVFLCLVIPMTCWLTLPCGLFSFHGLLVVIVGWHVWLKLKYAERSCCFGERKKKTWPAFDQIILLNNPVLILAVCRVHSAMPIFVYCLSEDWMTWKSRK